MNHRKKFIITFVVLSVIAISFILYARADYIGICDQVTKTQTCIGRLDDFVVGPLFTLSVVLAPFFLLLAFLSKEAANAWKKFSFWFIPIFAILVILASTLSDSFSLIPDTEMTTLFTSSIYIVISSILVIHQALRFRSKKDSEESKTEIVNSQNK